MKKVIKLLLFKLSFSIKNYFRNSKVLLFNNLNFLRFLFYKFQQININNLINNRKVQKKKHPISSKNKDIVFIYHSKRKNNASTIMRVFQLKDILKEKGDIDTKVADEKSLKYIKNSICILNKSFLIDASAREFETLKRQDNILCLDYIDSKEKYFQIKYSHCLIASSIKQFEIFKLKYKSCFIHLITHHVDPRLIKKQRDNSILKIGYFGESQNGLYVNYLNKYIDNYFINTNNQGSNKWLKKINDYDCHYIVRKKINSQINKPFLKGFTAAYTSSNVLVYENQGDCLYYLTKDYPYLIYDDSFSSILNMIEFMKDTYKSKIWLDGLEIMKYVETKSSNTHIINEFKSFIEYFNTNKTYLTFKKSIQS